jgi:hypothetical protein
MAPCPGKRLSVVVAFNNEKFHKKKKRKKFLNLYPCFCPENVKSKELGYKQKINLMISLKKDHG